MTAVVKMSNQLWIKYHSIETKRNQPKPRTEMHRGALAAVNRARRRCCRPRGRRRCNSSSRLRQAELVGRLDAQGVSKAETSFAATGEHNNDGAGSPEMSKASGKTEQGERAKTTVAQAIKRESRSLRKLRCGLHRASAMPRRPCTRLEANRSSPAM